MARRDDGHADLDDLHERLGGLNPAGVERRLELTNVLLQALLRHHGVKVPIAIYRICCDAWVRKPHHERPEAHLACYHVELVILHEGESLPDKCSKCGGPVRLGDR